jgi:hypothetical protein
LTTINAALKQMTGRQGSLSSKVNQFHSVSSVETSRIGKQSTKSLVKFWPCRRIRAAPDFREQA